MVKIRSVIAGILFSLFCFVVIVVDNDDDDDVVVFVDPKNYL